jgi:hypothetical protein
MDMLLPPMAVRFWKNARLCIPNDPVLKPKLLFELHDNGIACQRGYVSTLAKDLDMFGGVAFDKTITTNVTDVLFVAAPKSDPR